MNRLPKEELIDMLNKIFSDTERREIIEDTVRGMIGPTNPSSYTDSVVERATIGSYEYFLSSLKNGRETEFDKCQSEQEMLNRLRQKAKSEAIDLVRRKTASRIDHGKLDAPRYDEEDGSSLEYYEAMNVPDGDDPVTDELTVQAIVESLSTLPDDDREFMENLIGAQLDGGYSAPPFKAVAEKLGTTKHKVQYRWKKLKEEILDLTRGHRD